MGDEVTLKISEVHDLLVSIYRYNHDLASNPKAQRWEEPVVPYLRSTPGTGKTEITRQAAATCRYGFMSFIGAQYDPAEMAGFVFFDQVSRETWRAKPQFLPSDGEWVVLCDEFAQMTMMQKNIMAQLMQERRLGEHKLSPYATLTLAGNRQQDRAGAQPDPTHVIDRAFIINVLADFQDWCPWAVANGVRPEIIAYLRFREKYFNLFDPALSKNPSPRGWTKVSTFLNMEIASPIVEMATIQGQVGVGACSDFTGYLRVYRDLPDIDRVLANPKTEPVPNVREKPDVIYALCGALSYRATPKNFPNILQFCERMPPEFEAMTVKDCITRDPKIRLTKVFTEWMSERGMKLVVP